MASSIGEHSYDRNAIIEKIHDKYGHLEGENEYEKIYDACEKIKTTLDYDLNYSKVSLQECLDNNKGVCWHYAKIVSLLLDEEGIYNELVVGKYAESNSYHMWLRCKVNGKWVYTDPTMYKTLAWSYYNINYQTYVDNYKSLWIINI